MVGGWLEKMVGGWLKTHGRLAYKWWEVGFKKWWEAGLKHMGGWL